MNKVSFLASVLLLSSASSVWAAPPVAVDDAFNTTTGQAISGLVQSNDQDLDGPNDTFTVIANPSYGSVEMNTSGGFTYTPDYGFSGSDTFDYQVADDDGGSSSATVTITVDPASDYLTVASNEVTTPEDTTVSLGITVDPGIFTAGTLPDTIAVDTGFRAANSPATIVSSTIATDATGILITGFASEPDDTTAHNIRNENYQRSEIRVDLRRNSYSGSLAYISANGSAEYYSWSDIPLGQSNLTDPTKLTGQTGTVTELTITRNGSTIEIQEDQPLELAYHFEYISSLDSSTQFISSSSASLDKAVTDTSFPIPADLEPATGSQGYMIIKSAGSDNIGPHSHSEPQYWLRLFVDLETQMVSGVVNGAIGETEDRTVTYAFKNYPLVDKRVTPGAATPSTLNAGGTAVVGDTTAISDILADPTVYIDTDGTLKLIRTTDTAAILSALFVAENYERIDKPSIASFISTQSDYRLIDTAPESQTDEFGNQINEFRFPLPEATDLALLSISFYGKTAKSTNQNAGYATLIIDLKNDESSGYIVFTRNVTPDFLSWSGVPLGTKFFGAQDGGGSPLYTSNRALVTDFQDEFIPEARIYTEVNGSGTTELVFEAISQDPSTSKFLDYWGIGSASFLGNEPIELGSLITQGTLSHGSDAGSGWQIDIADLSTLSFIPVDHFSGTEEVTISLASTGESETITVFVEPVVDNASLVRSDVFGSIGSTITTPVTVTDSADTDGSEDQIPSITLTGIPAALTLSSSSGSITDNGGGSFTLDSDAMSSLQMTASAEVSATISVSGINTDRMDLDGDSLIEDGDNGDGRDELDSDTQNITFDVVVLPLPTVNTLTTNSQTPTLTGTANVPTGESLSVTVNGVTYTDGDGNLAYNNADDTWTLTIPAGDSLAEGTYSVTAVSTNGTANLTDLTNNELVVDLTAPAAPTVATQVSNDTTPTINGTATLGAGETLSVTINSVTYTVGDGNLTYTSGTGVWTLTIPVANALGDATYSVTATVADAAGNSTDDATTLELTVDTAAPAVTPTVTSQTTNDTTPTITGTATLAAGETLAVVVNGVTYTPGDGNLTHNGGANSWSLTIPGGNELTEGTYSVSATVTDAAGNSTADATVDEVVIDLTDPTVPTVVSQTTNDTTPDITGTATLLTGEALTVTVNSVTYTAGDGNLSHNSVSNTWNLTIPAGDALTESTFDVTATVTDAAGNASVDATASELIIDTTAPATAPTVDSLTDNTSTPTVTGTATLAAGETLSVTVDGVTYTVGDGNLTYNSGAGTWSLVIPAGNALSDGTYDVTATIADTAGNSTDDASSNELTIDTASPAIPAVTAQTTNDTTPTITGGATLAAGESLSVQVNGVTYTTGDGSLTHNNVDDTWSLTIPVGDTLSEGTYSVTATVTDTAGNSAIDATSSELIIDTTAPATAPTVISLTTNSTTPTLSGTATLAVGDSLQVSVNGVTYTAGDGNLTHNSVTDTWSLTIPAADALSEGTYNVTATISDTAGNSTSDASTDELVIDTTAPGVPTVASQTTNTTTPTITGTAVLGTGDTLTVTVNGVTYTDGDGNLTYNSADNTWSLTIPAANALGEGSHEVTATVTDSASNSITDATSNEIVIDTTAPAVPTVTAQTTNNTTPVITGAAVVGTGETLTVLLNGVTYTAGDGNLTLNSVTDTWSLTVPAANALTDAVYAVTATITDTAGNTSDDATTDELTIDTAGPAVTPTVDTLATNDTTPAVTGTATLGTGETLSVTLNGIVYTAGDGNLSHNSADDTWSLTVPGGNALADGVYPVVATVSDTAGNSVSDATDNELHVDTVNPTTIPTVSALVANSATPTLTGTATLAAGETLSVTVDGVTYSDGDGNLAYNSADNTWSLAIPAGNALTDGTFEVTATVTDAAGNITSDASTNELQIDTAAPAVVPTVTASTTSDTTPVISGTATLAAGEQLSVVVNGITYTTAGGNLTVDGGTNTWSLTIPAGNALAEGTYDVAATVTDAAGNTTADATSNELVVDTTPPSTAPTVTALTTNDTTPALSGTATLGSGETLTVTVNGVTYTEGSDLIVDSGTNTWSLTIPAGGTLTENTYDVSAVITDTAGNSIIDGTTDELIIDTTAPATVPTIDVQTTNSTSPVLTGTATLETGDTLSVTIDGTTYTLGDGYLTHNSADNTWSLTLPAAHTLLEGTYDVQATVTDSAGNSTSDSSSNELVIDTTVPNTPTVVSQTTNDTTPVITGNATLASGEQLTVIVDGTTYTVGDSHLTHNAGAGTWSLAIPLANVLNENTYEVTATISDTAGNSTTDGTSNELIIDVTAPASTATVTTLSTSDTTPVVSGSATVAADETLTVTVNGSTYTAGDGSLVYNSANDTWALTIPTGNELTDGTYEVTAIITDTAGNTTTDATSNELEVDTLAPVSTPTVTAATTNDTTPTISGTATLAAGEQLSVTVNGITYTVGDGNLTYSSADNTWSLTVPAGDTLPEATYDVTATVTDAAGNQTSDATTNELVIDTTANATTPSVSALTTNDTTPTLQGTATLDPGDTLTVEVNLVVYTDGDGNLAHNAVDDTWALTIPAGNVLAENTYDVTATITDLALNTVSDVTSNELIVDTTAPASTPTVDALDANSATPVVSGTAVLAAGDTLTVEINGVTYTAGDGVLFYNSTDNTWSLTIPATDALPEGTYDVVATITDTAGNATGDATANELNIDLTAPAIPTVTTQVTNSATPTVSGAATVNAGETLTVEINGVTYTDGDGNLVYTHATNSWVLSVPVADTLPDGIYSVTATVTDTAGNSVSDASDNELTVDTIAPSAPGVTSQTTADTTPMIEGTLPITSDAVLAVTVNSVTYTEGGGNLVNNNDGTWALTIPAANALPENSYDVVAVMTDTAGNTTSDPGSNELVVDTTLPATPGVTSLTTNDTTPTIQGTAVLAAGETLTVEVNGVIYTAGGPDLIHDSVTDTWTLTIPVANSLPEAGYDVTATVTDAASNTQTDPSSGELLIDTTAPTAPTIDTLITANTTPTVTGTATLAAGEFLVVTVNGVSYNSVSGDVVVNAFDNTWSLALPAADALADNVYNVLAVVNDVAGNTSADVTVDELTVDTTAPTTTPIVHAVNTNDPEPTITGTAILAPGETLSVEVNGVTYTDGDGNLTVNPDGTWSLTIPTVDALGEGTYDVIATVTDAAGNTTTDATTDELIIDTTAPADIPTVISQTTSDTTPVVTGTATAAAGESLSVTLNAITYTVGDGVLSHDNVTGNWTLSLQAADALVDGTYEVTATLSDLAGNTTDDITSDELVIDTVPPTTVPTVATAISGSTTPVVSGTATLEPGETLTVTVNGVTYTVGDGNLSIDGSGNWTLAIPAANALPEGTYNVSAVVTDAAGNTTVDATTSELTVDTTPPLIKPTVNAQTTGTDTPVITGTAVLNPGDTLTVTVNGVTYSDGDGNLVYNAGAGTWSLTIPATDALPDGDHDVIATITDSAGNATTDDTAAELTVDTAAPASVPTIDPVTSNSTTPTLTGTATLAPGETLSVTINGVTYTGGDGNLTVNPDGTWSLTIPPAHALGEGTYDVVATITDAAGNTTTDGTNDELVIDTTPPGVPTVDELITSSGTPTISGTVDLESGDTFSVTVNGVTYTPGDGNLTVDGSGNWSLTLPSGDELPDGTYNVVAQVTDVAGNSVIDDTVDEITIDSQLPTAPAIDPLTTNSTTPTITGTAPLQAGETLTVTVNGVTYTDGDGNLVVNPDGTWSLTIPPGNALPAGYHEITATVTDAAGNQNTDNTNNELLIDTTVPPAPGVTSQVSSSATPVISGTTAIASGLTLSVAVNGVDYIEGDGDLVNNGDGTWTLTIPTGDALADGVYDVQATLTDIAGNITQDISTDELTVDVAGTIAGGAQLPGVTSMLSMNTTPVITGTVPTEFADTLTVTVNGVTYQVDDGSLTVDENGNWSLTIPPTDALDPGTYDVVASVTDSSGQLLSDTSANELIIDPTAVSAPTVDPLTAGEGSPVITGTVSLQPGETFVVTVDGVPYTPGDGNLVVDPAGNWTLTLPASQVLTEGTYEVTATVTDVAGNTTTDSSTGEITIDSTLPAIPTIDTQITNVTDPVITGTADLQPGEVLTIDVAGQTFTSLPGGGVTVNPDGTWSLTLPDGVELDEGDNTVTATVTDQAGNSSSSQSIISVDTESPELTLAATITDNPLRPLLHGTTAEPDGTVISIFDESGNLVCSATVSGGEWSCTPAVDLPQGIVTLSATITDIAGNVSTAEIAVNTGLDSDNDGIPDTVEGNGDTDNDGVPNHLDLDADNDGLLDSQEITIDTDSDGVPNYIDLDSDNDGISDAYEAGGDDSDSDYYLDHFVDNNNNGLHDIIEADGPANDWLPTPDTDYDGYPDYLDLDSDQDGIPDILETSGFDVDDDGLIDDYLDANGDGIDDAHLILPRDIPDTDGDGLDDFRDLDSDNDGVFDVVEFGYSDNDSDGRLDTMPDADRDAIADSFDVDYTHGPDANNNGIDDRFDAAILLETDQDNDGIPDRIDPDGNGDGYADPEDRDPRLSAAIPDSNGDGIPDFQQATAGIRTGLDGHGGGCSLQITDSARKDPTLPFLLVFLFLWLLTRREQSRLSNEVKSAR